jgi:hypothetical protein
MNKLKVEAIPGILLPIEGKAGFVGWRRAIEGEAPQHDVPGGFGWVLSGPVEVADSRYYRTALRRGDIQLASASVSVADKAAKKGA